MATTFTSRRRELELVVPAHPTPHEYKALSDIDDERGLRYYPAGLEFFRCSRDTADLPSGQAIADDPVSIIRAALAEALVSYYPLAGRLVELPAAEGKLLVDCTAEGVVFVEADADVRVDDLAGQTLAPPYPWVEELLCCDIGFYGNGVIPLTAEATVDELCGQPLSHTIELLRKAKIAVTKEYVQSMLDLLAQQGRPFHSMDWSYLIADTTGLSRRAARLGRWERAGGGITTAGRVVATSLQSYYDRCKSGDGEFVTLSMCLLAAAMERFAERVTGWPNDPVFLSAL
ncbi:hypothetical protein QOZ80_9AG0677210 [Eleusine coracana subsp. coracana]|nr:hypothetical protein QOZ80_9AG0677210 [Eleusine coracana subsp. coracana]